MAPRNAHDWALDGSASSGSVTLGRNPPQDIPAPPSECYPRPLGRVAVVVNCRYLATCYGKSQDARTGAAVPAVWNSRLSVTDDTDRVETPSDFLNHAPSDGRAKVAGLGHSRYLFLSSGKVDSAARSGLSISFELADTGPQIL